MFADFTAPSGEAKKSKLGKHGRIRAVKFNFNTEPNGLDPVYSMGVMLPLLMVMNDMELSVIPDDLDTTLEVIKYEEPEGAYSGLAKGDLPVGMYMTDETNIFNSLRNLEASLPANMTGSIKVDGSSISIYVKSETEYGICSRKLEKKLEQKIIVGYKDAQGNKLRKHYIRETGQKGYFNDATSEFFTEIPESYTPIEEELDDTFIKLGLPILEKLKTYCLTNGLQLVLRGELCGQGLKGSGNKNNPHAPLKQQILLYGLDDYSSGVTIKQPLSVFYDVCKALDIAYCPVVFSHVFNSLDELKEECENYFKTNMIEGIVVRSDDSRFSAKYMNLSYDAQK